VRSFRGRTEFESEGCAPHEAPFGNEALLQSLGETDVFLRKVDGPRVVILPDGRSMSRADLPQGNNLRWTPQRKRLVAEAVQAGLLARDHAMRTYELSEQELETWCRQYSLVKPERAGSRSTRTSANLADGPGLTMG
jgi:hypothetical protein